MRHQSFSSNKDIFTGTRLISIILSGNLPRFVTINGYTCRIWYRGQPLVCNLCAVQGHHSANCPNKDKCRRCDESGHFACTCLKAWGACRAGHQGGQDHPPEAMNVDPTAKDPQQNAPNGPPADDSESAGGGHAPPSGDSVSPPSQPNEGPPPHVGFLLPPGLRTLLLLRLRTLLFLLEKILLPLIQWILLPLWEGTLPLWLIL